MNVNMHLAICGVLLLLLIVSFLYRKFLDDHEDHNIHLSNPTDVRAISLHESHCKRIEQLGTLNKYLSIVIVLYLIAIGVFAAYTGWFTSSQLS